MVKYTGQVMQIISAAIEVSANELIEGGYGFHLNCRAIFPRCKKAAIVHYTVGSNAICCRNLYSHHGRADIHPNDWKAFISVIPVVSDRISPVELTPELIEKARASEAHLADLAAEGNDCPTKEWDAIEFA
jgi:hypothetical protein